MLAQWLLSDSLEPYISFGNGATTHVSPVGLLARSEGHAIELAEHVVGVTHNHPEVLKVTSATALAIYLARCGQDAAAIGKAVTESSGCDLDRTPDDIRPTGSTRPGKVSCGRPWSAH